MPVGQFQNWFDACCNGDADAVKGTLTAATKEERDRLLNGQFDYRFVVLLPLNLSPLVL